METDTIIYIGIGSVFALLIAIIGATWKLGNWHGSVNTSIRGINDSIQGILEELKYLRGRIDEMFGRQAGRIADAKSPLKLNELGKKVSNEFGAKDWASRHVDLVRDKVVGMEAYDVREFCFNFVTEDRFTEAELKQAKNVAYDNGLVIQNVLRVTSFELRDLLLTPDQVNSL